MIQKLLEMKSTDYIHAIKIFLFRKDCKFRSILLCNFLKHKAFFSVLINVVCVIPKENLYSIDSEFPSRWFYPWLIRVIVCNTQPRFIQDRIADRERPNIQIRHYKHDVNILVLFFISYMCRMYVFFLAFFEVEI